MYLTDHFTVLDPPNPSVDQICVVSRCQLVDFETLKLWKGRSGDEVIPVACLSISLKTYSTTLIVADAESVSDLPAFNATDIRNEARAIVTQGKAYDLRSTELAGMSRT